MLTQITRVADVLLRLRIGSILLFLPVYLYADFAKMYPLAPVALGIVLSVGLIEQLVLWDIYRQGGRVMYREASLRSAAMDAFAFSLFSVVYSLHRSLAVQLIAGAVPIAFIVCLSITRWFADLFMTFKKWLAFGAHFVATVIALNLAQELVDGRSTYVLFSIVLAYSLVSDKRLHLLIGVDRISC